MIPKILVSILVDFIIVILDIRAEEDKMENLEYNKIEEWDSIGHMTLIAELEQIFEISIDTDDVIDFSSFKKGKQIVKKYGINVE